MRGGAPGRLDSRWSHGQANVQTLKKRIVINCQTVKVFLFSGLVIYVSLISVILCRDFLEFCFLLLQLFVQTPTEEMWHNMFFLFSEIFSFHVYFCHFGILLFHLFLPLFIWPFKSRNTPTNLNFNEKTKLERCIQVTWLQQVWRFSAARWRCQPWYAAVLQHWADRTSDKEPPVGWPGFCLFTECNMCF